MSQNKALSKFSHKIKSIEFKSNKANIQEANELMQKLTEVEIKLF